MRYAFVLIVLLALGLEGCSPFVRSDTSLRHDYARVVSICSLAGRDASSVGSEIRVRAYYITDYMERSRLADPACKSAHVEMHFAPLAIGSHGKPARKDLETIILRDLVENNRTGVYIISFDGHFKHENNKRTHVVIYIDRVWSFKRVPCTAFYTRSQCKSH